MYTAHILLQGETHSVEEHLKGTMSKSQNYTENLDIKIMAELQSILHDAGKFCKDFDDYINGNNDFKRGDIDHSYAGARIITESADEMGGEYYNSSRLIAHSIVSHHGLHDWYDCDGHDYLKKRINNDRNYHEITKAFSEIYDKQKLQNMMKSANNEYNNIISKIDDLSGDTNTKKRAFYHGLFERLMQSILVDADRTDTADFMSQRKTEMIYTDEDLKKVWNEMHDRLEAKLLKFADRTDAVSMRRKNISERCRDFAKNDVKICRLIVPAGGGKTLSSLRFAIDYCMGHDKEKIFYIAPFMSILEQNSDEIRSITSDEYFIEHHSNVLNEISSKEELEEYELRTEKWDAPVIATTMVQFLNTLFSGKMSAVRRMHRLTNAVIIIDEVQSIPIKCINLFNLAINFLSHICGCTIVLCSATQPVFENTEYPMIIDENESMTGDYSEDFKVFERTKIIPEITKFGMTYDEAAVFCRNKYEKSGNLLLIVNTKKSAETIYRKMKEMSFSVQPEIIHLSTNMCPMHRKVAIEKIRNNLDKPVICITTQLIEAGVDISFKCVVRSLAGLDNVAQAAGRCNRHGENNELCPVYIIDIKDESLEYLADIKRARGISRGIITQYTNSDYTSPEILTEYYKNLLDEAKDELNYNIKKNNDTLINYLSLNSKRHHKYKNRAEYNILNKDMAQAFKTSGELFDVIDAATEGVIVYYNDDAERIINALLSDIKSDETVKLLRESQKYTVSVYPNGIRKMKENGALMCIDTVNILKKEYYDKETGIKLESGLMEFLGM